MTAAAAGAAGRGGGGIARVTLQRSSAFTILARRPAAFAMATAHVRIPIAASIAAIRTFASKANQLVSKPSDKPSERLLLNTLRQRVKERARKEKEDGRQKLKAKADQEKQKHKEKAAKEKQLRKEKAAKEKQLRKEKADRQKEREKKLAEKEKAKRKPWDLLDAKGNKVPLPLESKPKRRSAFVFFLTERLEALKEDPQYQRQGDGGQTKIVTSAIFAKAGTEWKSLNVSQRQRYLDASKREGEEYARQLAQWHASLSDIDRKRIDSYNRHLRAGGLKHRPTRLSPKADAPKKPLNPFLSFLCERRAEVLSEGHSVTPVSNFARKVGDEWKQMSVQDKQPYQSKYDEAFQKYAREVEEYKRRTAAP